MTDPAWEENTVTRNVRKRTSKWDVMAETHFPSEIRQEAVLPVKPDDLFDGKELNKDSNSSYDNKQSSMWPKLEDGGTVKDFPERSRFLNHPIVEAGNKEGSNMSSLDLISGIQSTLKDGDVSRLTELLATGPDQNYNKSLSPGPDTWRRHSRSISPRIGRSRSSRSRSQSRSGNRSWSRSRSQSRSRSRSWNRSRSGSRSRSRSRSPLKRGSERWTSRGRVGAGRSGVPCRDFSAGRCRRGSQCAYLHADGRRQYDRHFDNSRRGMGEGRLERERYKEHDNNGNTIEPWDRRDKFSNRHGSHYVGDPKRPELHRNNKSTERCFDFTKGRCHRGSTCRYLHHDPSSDGGRYMQDETRERTHGTGESDRPFARRLEHQRARDTPCKYFAEGCCTRGEHCKFSHQVMPYGNSEGRQSEDRHGYNRTDNNSWSGPDWKGQAAAVDGPNSSRWMNNEDGAEVSARQPMHNDHCMQESQHPQLGSSKDIQDQLLPHQALQSVVPSQEQNIPQEAPAFHQHGIGGEISQDCGSIFANSARSQSEMKFANKAPPLAPIPGRKFGQNTHNQYIVSQSPHGHGFPPTVQIQQASPLPSSGQMQQVVSSQPSNWQGQFVGLQVSSNPQNFNLGVQPVLPPLLNGPSQEGYTPGGKPPQNLPHFGQSQHIYNLTGQSQQSVTQNGQSQPNFDPIAQVRHIVTQNEQNLQSFNISGQNQQNLPQPQSQQIIQALALNGQHQHVVPQPLSNTQHINSDERNYQKVVDKPSQLAADNTVIQKVITSEEAAQITNLSASLALFFANGPQLPQLQATLNPVTAAVITPQQTLLNPGSTRPPAPEVAHLSQLNQGSLTSQQPDSGSDSMEPPGFPSMLVEQKNPKTEEVQATSKGLAPYAGGGTNYGSLEEKLHDGTSEPKQFELNGDTESKVDETETGQSKKEQTAQSENVDVEIRTDGESKRCKDSKGIRMFKSALVEFVKDVLKPTWKEGQLSKEAHKTIVKKVVEKVTGAMQGPNIPQTPEKIDSYLSHSRAKLSKLVQAYIDKYVKR